MTYDTAIEYLESFINYERETAFSYAEAFTLDRMRALAYELGNPQKSFESIIIAGSKGKGSTAAILSSILRMEDLKVGLYTSPHLVDLSERIQVNGLCISQSRFIERMQSLKKILESYEWRKNPPTYFELLTLVAFCHFKEMKVNVAVLEVGLGGLLDSTNIAPAKVVGLTPISLEHTDLLGKTLSKIAVQKCGIIKGREVVVSALQAPEVQKVILEKSEDREAPLFRLGQEIKITERNFDEESQSFDLKTPWANYFDLKIKLLGKHQIENAALAISLAKALELKTRIKISDEAVKLGVLDAVWPGRIEKIDSGPTVILDGAHTPDSIEKLLTALKRHFHYENLVVIFGVSADKNVKSMLERLKLETATLIATESESPRAMAAQSIAELWGLENIFVEKEPEAAFLKARQLAGSDDLILVTGSLYLVGEFKNLRHLC